MSLSTTIAQTASQYIFTVTDGTEENTFEYRYSKDIPVNNQTEKKQLTVQEYLLNCKRDVELLAADEIARKQPPVEIVI